MRKLIYPRTHTHKPLTKLADRLLLISYYVGSVNIDLGGVMVMVKYHYGKDLKSLIMVIICYHCVN